MQLVRGTESKVRLSGLKRFAIEHLADGLLKDDILSQPDEIDPIEFLANARVWLRIARDNRGRRWKD